MSAQIPPSFIAHEEVPTPWDSKGAVMREIVERSKGEELVLVDGVKIIRPEGWVLVLPDPELPSTHVWAEGDTEREARRLVAVQAGRIAEIATCSRPDARSFSPAMAVSRRPSVQRGARVGPRRRGPIAEVGITDFAQDNLGDIVYVQLPEVGADARARRDLLGSGVDEVGLRHLRPGERHRRRGQRGAHDHARALNSDPYGEGWIFRVELSDPAELDALMDAALRTRHSSTPTVSLSSTSRSRLRLLIAGSHGRQ